MSRLKKKVQNSKLYSANWLSLTHNNDLSHQKLWNQKAQQAKHIQQQKQIDRILCGIVKERLFGQLLSHQTRISDEGFYTLDKMSKQLVNRIQAKNSRKISPLPNQPTYQIQAKNRIKHKTIDLMESRTTDKLNKSINEESLQLRPIKFRSKKSIQNSLNKTKKLFFNPVQISSQKLSNLHTHFREITNSQTPIIYDIKLTKQMLIKYNKQKNIVSQRCLQRFLYFFNFPGAVNIKQYGNWIESALNCSINQSSFYCFQVLDQSQNGFLTISDLFRALQDFPIVHPSLLQKQIYQLMEQIKNITQLLINSGGQNLIKPTVEQLIVRNQNLKIQQMRDLVKQSGKQLVSANCFKSTAYHKSMYALQHNSSTRQKNLQLQYSQHKEQLKNNKNTQTMKQDGIRFRDYAKTFINKRSQLFLLVAKILIGVDSAILQ